MNPPARLTLAPQGVSHPIGAIQDPQATVGLVHVDAAEIHVGEQLLDQILEYSERDFERETGGFLLGDVSRDSLPRVTVRHFLPAIQARSQFARLTFTHESWATLNHQAQDQFPDDVVIGWQHTHLNLGVFLSAYDLFLHRHFFRELWHIALVVDPVRQELGFFQWRNKNVVDCGFVLERGGLVKAPEFGSGASLVREPPG